MENEKEKKILFWLSIAKFSDNDLSLISDFFNEIIYYLAKDKSLMKGLKDSTEDFIVEYILKFLQKIRKDRIELPSIEYLTKFLPFIESREYSDSFRKDGLWKVKGRPNKINRILEQNPNADFFNEDLKKTIIEENSKTLYYELLKKWKGAKKCQIKLR